MERITARDPLQKELAIEKKEERKTQAELEKQQARQHNAAAKQMESTPAGGHTGYTNTTTGAGGPTSATYGGTTTGTHRVSATPGHGTGQGQHLGQVTVTHEGVESHPHPVGTRRTTTHNTSVEENNPPGSYGSGPGGNYS